jgi:hypothetical protein
MNKRIILLFILFPCFLSNKLLAQITQDSVQTEKTATRKVKKMQSLKMSVSPSVVELLGYETTKFLANADQVALYTIDFNRDSVTNVLSNTHILGYKILSKADKLPNTALSKLSHTILNPASYLWDGFNKSCVFTPYIAAVFNNSKSKDKMVALFCFSCDEWEFHFKNKTVKEDSDLARRQLLYQFKGAFKDNKTIQSLN